MNTPEIQVEIAPDLAIAHDGALTTVEGRVAVPWARIELVETPPAAVAPSALADPKLTERYESLMSDLD